MEEDNMETPIEKALRRLKRTIPYLLAVAIIFVSDLAQGLKWFNSIFSSEKTTIQEDLNPKEQDNPVKYNDDVKNSEVTQPTNRPSGEEQSSESSTTLPANISERENKKPGSIDYSSFVNTSLRNSPDNIEVSVTIIDQKGNISGSVSSSIANIYNQAGKKGNTGLIRSSFIKKPQYQELIEGNSDVVEKLNLNAYADYVALGQISFSHRPGTLVDGTVVCTASISMSIISTSTATIAQSFTISNANGNGATKDQAQENALQKLLNKYYTNHSSL